MKNLYKELEKEIEKEEEKRGKPIPSAVITRLKMCSDKLLYVKTGEDIDKVLRDYHISSASIGKDISWTTSEKFDRFIEEEKKQLK